MRHFVVGNKNSSDNNNKKCCGCSLLCARVAISSCFPSFFADFYTACPPPPPPPPRPLPGTLSLTEPWGIECKRYEIRDISPPQGVRAAMELQAEAERRRRADVLTSEGERQAEVNIAEGKRQAVIFEAEAHAEEIKLKAEATAAGIESVAKAIAGPTGADAVSMRLAEQYLEAFGQIAKQGNTIVLPANAGDASSMVAQATAIFQNLQMSSKSGGPEGSGGESGNSDDFQPEPLNEVIAKLNKPN